MSIDAKCRLASTTFVILLLLSVLWPSPIVGVNRLCCNAPLGIDELSFLGREAPSWDVVFWCICGLFALSMLRDARGWRAFADEFRLTRLRMSLVTIVEILGAAAIGAIIWMRADSAVNEWSERVNSDQIEDWIRVANRFGGGMNPVMIIVFFALAGIAYGRRRWIGYAIRMTLAGAAGGVIVQLVK